MRRKLFLLLAIMAIIACVFAISASAKASTSTLDFSQSFGELNTTSSISVGSTITDTTARVVFDDGKTYPAYYIVLDQATFATSYDAINTAFSTGYTDANVVRLEIPEGVTTLSDYFKNGTNMPKCEEVVLPDSLTSIASYVFAYNTVIKSVTMSANATQIPNQMFERSYNLEEFIVPESNKITYVGWHSFGMSGGSGTPKITRVENLTNVVTIKYNAFVSCSSLQYVELGDAVETIESNAFNACVALTNFHVSKNLKSVGTDAFKNCQSITTLVFPDNCVVPLGKYQFENCYLLTKLVIKKTSSTELGEGVFYNCKVLSELDIPTGFTAVGTKAFQNTALTFFSFDGCTITSLPNHVFAGCTKLKKIILPEGVTSIGNFCLEKCTALEEVWMPNQTAITFNEQVFGQCGGSRAIKFYFPSASCTVTFTNTTIKDDPFMNAYNGNTTSATIVYSEPLTTKCTNFYGAHTTPSTYDDCREKFNCAICSTEQSAFALTHNLKTVITYSNGFDKAGKKTVTCLNSDACTCENFDGDALAIFTAKGYSYKQNAENSGLSGGFEVNGEALDEYKGANPNAQITVSLLIVNPNYLVTDGTDTFFNENGVSKASGGVIQVNISDLIYTNYDYMIRGFNLEHMQSLELAFAMVVVEDGELQVIQKTYTEDETPMTKATYADKDGIKLDTVTVESIDPEMVALLKEQEELEA